jgi:trehalose 6-phosphate synthase
MISVPRRGAARRQWVAGRDAGARYGLAGTATRSKPLLRSRPWSQGRVTYASIDFGKSEYQDFYLGFCNGTLWPLFHYFVDGFRYNDAQYRRTSK